MSGIPRASLPAAAGALALACAPVPASAQADRGVVMTILLECAKIADLGTRTLCYDNNIRLAQGPATTPVRQQGPDDADRVITINILLECAKINDPSPRTSCFDSNIRARASPNGQAREQAVQSAAGAARESGVSVARSSEREPQLQKQRDADPPAGRDEGNEPRALEARVASVVERRPGAYLVTLEDGGQWEFVEGMPPDYWPPQRGSIVQIERGALGSFLLRFDRQQGARVQRIR